MRNPDSDQQEPQTQTRNVAKLRAETDSWRKIVLEHALDAVIGMDQQGTIIDWNRQAEVIFGYTKAQALGRNFTQTLIPPGEREAHLRELGQLNGRAEGFFLNERFELTMVHHNGSTFPVEMTMIPVRQKGIHLLYSFLRDITSKVQADEALKTSEARFRTLFEQAPFSIQLVAANGQTIQVNQAWRDLLQVPNEIIENYILKNYNILEDPQLKAKGLMPSLLKAFAGESSQTPPICYDPAEMGKPGRPRWLEAFLYPVKDRAGRVSEVVFIHEDVTERKHSEEERNRLLEELKSAVESRDEFLSIASHELKTPLTSMKLQAQLQKSWFEKGDLRALERSSVKKLIDVTVRQVERLSKLVEDMFDVSRISYGKLRIEPEEVDLGQLVQDVVDRFAPQLDAAECSYRLTVENQVMGQWDRFRLEQVLSNLLSNAIKYGFGRSVEITAINEGGKAVFAVKDYGPGIEQKNLELIFQRFERAIPSNNISGLGLGLYISRQIIEAHGGAIHVESVFGQWSKFSVRIAS